MPNESGLNILKMLEDHLDAEIQALEKEADALETTRQELDKRMTTLRAIKRVTNVSNRNQESQVDRPGRIALVNSDGSTGV